MLTYNDLYEYLRKEKYAERLQSLPKNFVPEISEYFTESKKRFSSFEDDMFAEDVLKEKKQLENAISLFKELILRRKRKILDLVFVAAETGIMKRDYSDMLSFEQELFENLVKGVNDSEGKLNELMNGKKLEVGNKMVIMLEDVEKFVEMSGSVVGPFKSGEVVNLDTKVAAILVSGKKARNVDE